MLDNMHISGVRRGIRRPSLAKRITRAVDVGITRTQEWLEGEDKPGALVVGYGICGIVVLYLIIQIVRWIWWN